MSIKIMTAVWATQVGSHTDKLVLLALADNANDDGECYPSLSTIARRSECDRRTVMRILGRLESRGLISRERRQAGAEFDSTLYRISLDGRGTAPLEAQRPQGHSAPRVGAHSPQGRGTVPSLPPPITPSLSGTVIEPSLNRQPARARRKSSEPTSEEPPPSNLNVEAWHRWEQYRRSIRKPIHPASRLSAQRKLAGFGADQDVVVEQSIANGWQGLFELKANGKASIGQTAYRPAKSADELEAEALARGENPWA